METTASRPVASTGLAASLMFAIRCFAASAGGMPEYTNPIKSEMV